MKSCSNCRQFIRESHLLLADCQYWHEDCLRCVCCDARLAELDKIFYRKAHMSLCRRDYLRLYGSIGQCAMCQKRVNAYEFVMKVKTQIYHLNCFCCQYCQMRFCVGDRFYIHNNLILCEQDYMELSSSSNIIQTYSEQPIKQISINSNDTSKSALNSFAQLNQINNYQSQLKLTELENNHQQKHNNQNFEFTDSKINIKLDLKTNSNVKQIDFNQNEFHLNSNKLISVPDDQSSGYGSPSSPKLFNDCETE